MTTRFAGLNRSVPILVSAWALFVLAIFLFRAPWEGVLRLFESFGRVGPWPDAPVVFRRAAALFTSWGFGFWILYLNLRLGSFIARRIAPRLSNPWVRTAIHFLLGAAALQAFWLGLGFNHLWRPGLLAACGVVATVFFLAGDIRDWARPLRLSREADPGESTLSWEKALIALGGFSAVLGFLVAVLPETFYDSMAYVLAVPEQWLITGGVPNHPWHLYDHFYLGASLWFANGLAAGGESVARVQSVALLPACALLAGGWAAEAWGKRAGVVVLGWTLTFPLLALNTWACRSDAFLAFALLAGCYFLARPGDPQEVPSVKSLFMAGLALGLAISAKYVALTAAPAAALLLFARRHRVGWKGLSVFAGGFAILAAPWAVRGLLETGNPVYPYLPDVFGGARLPDWGLSRLLSENRLTPVSWLSWPPAPWRMMTPGYGISQNTGPLALALLPILFLNRNVRTRLFWATVVLFLFGLAAAPVLRFQLAGFLLVFLLLARGLEGVSPSARSFLGWTTVACALAGMVLLISVLGSRFDPIGYWALREDASAYARRVVRHPTVELANVASVAVPRDGRLLLVGDGRALGYRCQVLWNSVDDEPFLSRAVREEKDPKGILGRLRRSRVTHVAFNLSEARETAPDYGHWRLTREERARLIQWCRAYLQPQWASKGCSLFRVGIAEPEKARKGARPHPWETDAFWEDFFPPPAND